MSQTLTLKECGQTAFTVVSRGVCYRYDAEGVGLSFTFDRLRWSFDELRCELTVRCSLAGVQANDGAVSQASFNVSSDRARTERAAKIVKAANLREIPVDRLLEDACQRVLSAERSSAASISLHDIDEGEEEPTFSCDGITINLTQISMFFGLPGSGKSLQAERLALELVRAGYRAAYIDFEWEPRAHRKRARLLYGPQFPDIRYLRLDRPLVAEIDGLRRTAVEEGWDFCVIDSVSFGVAGAPESAEVASTFLQACRQLRIGVLLVAHQTKGEGGDKFPFGSILWHAGGRDIYHFRRSNSDDDRSVLVTAVTHRKTNDVLRPPIAIEYTFNADRITVAQVNPAAIADLAPELPIRTRMRYALSSGPRSVGDLAEELDAKPNTIAQTLKRDDDGAKAGKVRMFVKLPDSRIGLYQVGA